MNINILRYSLFGIARCQEVDHTFVKFIIYPLTIIALLNLFSVVTSIMSVIALFTFRFLD